jgi:signal transduction histidine kinase
MTSRPTLEPGLLPVFRLLIGIRLGLLWLSVCLWIIAPDQREQRFPFLGVAETVLLLVYLSIPWLQRVLGRLFLPLAITIATIGPVLEYAANVAVRLQANAPGDNGAEIISLIMVMFIPLLVVSWQYNFRAVLLYCVGTSIFDTIVAIPLNRVGGPPVGDIIGLAILRSVLFILVGFMVVRLMHSQRSQRHALADANTQLTRYASALEQLTISRERNRIARELHDTLAHTLSALAVQLEAINSLWETDPPRSRAMLDQSLAMTRSGLVESRRAIHALRSTPLEDLGLTLAVTSLAESIAARTGIALDVYIPDPIPTLRPEVEQTLYRIADEALTNVANHAQARHLSVKILPSPSAAGAVERGVGGEVTRRLTLTIADDGLGFDASQAANGRYGLRGLQERADLIGASLSVSSTPGEGTRIEVSVEVQP